MDINEIGNISDPSDFKTTKLPNLAELDLLKRCFICKDFFQAPVTISTCHHIYCSQCIREHLLRNSSCPICKCEVFESNLRPDPLLEDIVRCYKILRPQLLMLLKKNDPVKEVNNSVNLKDQNEEKSAEMILNNEEIRVNGEINEEDTKNDMEKDTKQDSETIVIDDSIEVIEIISEDEDENDPKIGTCPICQEKMAIEILERSHVEDCLSGRKPKRNAAQILQQQPKKKQAKGITSITSFFKQSNSLENITSPSPPPPPAQKWEREREREQQYKHRITPQPQQQQQEQELNEKIDVPVINVPARIPKLDFHSLTTPKVKAKLKELQLSTTGDRNELMRRYNQYFVFVNANIDSNHPVDESTLRNKLSRWERSFKSKSKDSLDTEADWKSLIAKARHSK